jgi:transposase
MAEERWKFDEDFKQGAVRIAPETGKLIGQVAREMGINECMLGNWCARDRRSRGGDTGPLSGDERAEPVRELTQPDRANWPGFPCMSMASRAWCS